VNRPPLQILSFHFFDGVVGGACRERHKSERWVLVAGGCHTGSVGDEDVLAGVELIPFVE
jgi:hypothetical protein